MADLLTAAMLADDMDIMDNVQSVIVIQRNPDTGAPLATNGTVKRLRRVVSEETVGVGEGEVSVTKARHHLKAAGLAWVPKKRDTITDDDGTWVIDGVSVQTFGTRYVCEATLQQGTP